jgi:hypothetical protein
VWLQGHRVEAATQQASNTALVLDAVTTTLIESALFANTADGYGPLPAREGFLAHLLVSAATIASSSQRRANKLRRHRREPSPPKRPDPQAAPKSRTAA